MDVVPTCYREVENPGDDAVSERTAVVGTGAGTGRFWYQMALETALRRQDPPSDRRQFVSDSALRGVVGSLGARFESPSLRQDGAAAQAAPSLLLATA